MITTTEPLHLLRISDLSPDQLDRLLRLAADMKAEPLGWRDAQAGKVVACFFSKPSTRTRVSLEAAADVLAVIARPAAILLQTSSRRDSGYARLAARLRAQVRDQGIPVLVIDGENARRLDIGYGQITEVGDVTYVDGEAISYEVTISCDPDDNGDSLIEYLTDPEGDGSGEG